MKFGQITNRYHKYSTKNNYIQFDICGLKKDEAVNKLKDALNKNECLNEIILHSDWTKKGNSENNFPSRLNDYIEIYTALSKYINVIGLTLHPMFRNKIDLNIFLSLVNQLEVHMPVFIENRSNSKILISKPNEIIELSQYKHMTIDIPQLLISCDYNYDLFLKTLSKIKWDNVREIHLANLKRVDGRCFVGRSLDDGVINIKDIAPYLKNKLITLEILGGINTFERNIHYIKENL